MPSIEPGFLGAHIVIVGVLGIGFWGDHSAPVKACQAIERAVLTESDLMVCEETKMGIDALGTIHAELLVWFCLLSCINSKYQSSSSGVQLNQHTKTQPQSILLKPFQWFCMRNGVCHRINSRFTCCNVLEGICLQAHVSQYLGCRIAWSSWKSWWAILLPAMSRMGA